ncbi:hypothetical protein JHFBIEKO_4050 [Methylobacterium mesophilicum]|nr:hypothetical protein JHFBIEKO_4050 [Methylobacterium mesophilicum]
MSCSEVVFRSMCREAMTNPRVGKEVFKLVAEHEAVAVADQTNVDPAQSEAMYQNYYIRIRRQILAELSLADAANTDASDNDNPGPGSDSEQTP